ncbi:MAG: lactonase family protein [Chitinophagaceae bacterium]|nr:lactonase family protein [Chitinophagaceae bacterium]
MKEKLLSLFLCFALSASAQQEQYLLVGTYTSGKSEGIYVYTFNVANAETRFVHVAKSSNPSFLAVSTNNKFVYAVNENADSTGSAVSGSISAFSFNAANGGLTALNKISSVGKHPCYVAVDKSGKWVFAGNYSSGNIGLLRLHTDGSLDSIQQIIQHSGSGPDKNRQQGPHVHATFLSSDNTYLFVPDLGIDTVKVYNFKKSKGKLKLHATAASKPGSGPRHFDIAPGNKFAYLLEEMSGTVVCYKLRKGNLQFQQRISILRADYKGAIGGADIHVSPDGKFLYCSNRGDDNSISIFAIHPADGKLTLIGHQQTFGKTPRNFNFDPSGNFLLVANQNTNEIVIFKIERDTGLLTDTGKRINVPNPVCIAWIQ